VALEGSGFRADNPSADHSGATVPDFHRLPTLGNATVIKGAMAEDVNIVVVDLAL
jgi:hypothetical protein